MGQFDAEQLEESTTSLVSSSTSAYSSFPVDVVVYVRVQVLTTRVFCPPHMYGLHILTPKPANWRCSFRCGLWFFQPSQIRFSCLPMSRVECMLKLPSLDLVFSSNRGERENPAGAQANDGPHPASSTPPGQHVPKTLPTKGLPLPLPQETHLVST